MEVVLSSEEMRICDRYAIEKLRIPGSILMENAGIGVVEAMERHYGSLAGKSAVILCGKGNNGGDGFVVARHLYNRGVKVTVALLGKSSDVRGDAKLNFEIVKKLIGPSGIKFSELTSSRQIKLLPKSEFIVDAIFGTGFSGEVKGLQKEAIEWMNRSPAKRISIDIPSGLNSDDGNVESVAAQVDLTVTMGVKKTGLIVGQAKSYVGRLEVANISIPKFVVEKQKAQTFLVEENDVAASLPRRPFNVHKHSVGKVFVIAGSVGLTGAAALTARSALMAGAGAVILGTPKSVYPILAKKLTDVMVFPLEDTSNGSVSLNAYDQIRKHLDWADVVAIGPGLSRNNETQELVIKVIRECSKSLVIDADALNALAENMVVLKKRKSKQVILTPHTGEFSRLTGVSSSVIEKNRVEAARDFAKKYKLTLVLKGAPTVTAISDGRIFLNSTGNPGMATAGSGDVLTGCICSLMAQGMEQTTASWSGVYVHGLSGDIARESFGERSMLASDILESLPEAIRRIERGISKA